MGPPPDNCVQTFHWSCMGTSPDARIRLSAPVGLPRPGRTDDADLQERIRVEADGALTAAGYRTPGEARDAISLPPGRHLVIGWDGLDPDTRPAPLRRDLYPPTLDPRECVRAALILSLCSTHLYDPDGPVLWTAHRLRRLVRLGESRNFHGPG